MKILFVASFIVWLAFFLAWAYCAVRHSMLKGRARIDSVWLDKGLKLLLGVIVSAALANIINILMKGA